MNNTKWIAISSSHFDWFVHMAIKVQRLKSLDNVNISYTMLHNRRMARMVNWILIRLFTQTRRAFRRAHVPPGSNKAVSTKDAVSLRRLQYNWFWQLSEWNHLKITPCRSGCVYVGFFPDVNSTQLNVHLPITENINTTVQHQMAGCQRGLKARSHTAQRRTSSWRHSCATTYDNGRRRRPLSYVVVRRRPSTHGKSHA